MLWKNLSFRRLLSAVDLDYTTFLSFLHLNHTWLVFIFRFSFSDASMLVFDFDTFIHRNFCLQTVRGAVHVYTVIVAAPHVNHPQRGACEALEIKINAALTQQLYEITANWCKKEAIFSPILALSKAQHFSTPREPLFTKQNGRTSKTANRNILTCVQACANVNAHSALSARKR